MSDTQWTRYQVFLQEKPGDPYQDVGSVHAPDGEMALLNARDVFARRPSVASIWVVPADAIFSKTRQELEEHEIGEKGQGLPANQATLPPLPAGEESGVRENYHAYCKPKPSGTQILIGTVEAFSPEEAMRQAIASYSERFPAAQPPFAWWVFPARLATQSDPQEAESLFAPALDKPFRLSTDFHVITAMRTIKIPGPGVRNQKKDDPLITPDS